MITCNIMGGLGNQLFQIFTTIAYALKHNEPFIFTYAKMFGKRPAYWDNFLYPLRKFTTLNRIQGSVLREKGFHYEELHKNLNQNQQNIILYGYFQSEKYFQEHAEEIAEMIMNLKETKKILLEREFKQLDPKKTISMHFRLGDYMNLQEFHPVLPLTYYKNSLNTLIEKTETTDWTVLYFCEEDDSDYVKEEYIKQLEKEKDFKGLVFIQANPRALDYEQMIMMSCCQHHIIANSSFSWWGAYLHFSSKKIVCSPAVWFGPKLFKNDTKDLIPDSWLKI